MKEMSQIDLHHLPVGSEIEIFPEAAFPVIQRGPMHAFLCADAQGKRRITTGGGTMLFGAATAEALADRLKSLGYSPTIVR